LSSVDHSFFLKHVNNKIIVILVYVDDLVLTRNNIEEINNIITLLDQHFKIKNLGDLTYFIGLDVARNSSGLHLSQHKYVLDLLHETGMLDFAPMPTPMTHSSRLISFEDFPLTETKSSTYCTLISRLIYLTNTRPDIAFCVNNLSQFLSSPTKVHQQVAFRILRYLKGNPGSGIFFNRNRSMQLRGHSEFDRATYPETIKSVTGVSIFLGESLISWKKK